MTRGGGNGIEKVVGRGRGGVNVWTESSRAQHQSRVPPPSQTFSSPTPTVTLTRVLSDSAGVLVDASCADTSAAAAWQKARPEESKRCSDITFPPPPTRARAEGWRAQRADLGASDGSRYEATMDGIPDERLDAGGSRCRRD